MKISRLAQKQRKHTTTLEKKRRLGTNDKKILDLNYITFISKFSTLHDIWQCVANTGKISLENIMIWNSFEVVLQKNGVFLEQPHLLLATERETKIVHYTDQSKKKFIHYGMDKYEKQMES